jgi:hypothetical protein
VARIIDHAVADWRGRRDVASNFPQCRVVGVLAGAGSGVCDGSVFAVTRAVLS